MVNASPFDEASLDGRNPIAVGPESIQRALATLDALDSAILRLAYHHGTSQAEVAQELGLPISEVRTRSSVALRQLARILTPLRAGIQRRTDRAPNPLHLRTQICAQTEGGNDAHDDGCRRRLKTRP
jgi:hypothetical protein